MSAHESAMTLARGHVRLGEVAHDLEEARVLGTWEHFRTGDDSARNALRDILATIERTRARLEKIVHAAANTPAGAPLSLRPRSEERSAA